MSIVDNIHNICQVKLPKRVINMRWEMKSGIEELQWLKSKDVYLRSKQKLEQRGSFQITLT